MTGRLTVRDDYSNRTFPAGATRLSPSQAALFDLMRGLSAQVVLVGHALDATGVKLPCYPPDLAVVVFLFISGFLITYSTAVKGGGYTMGEFLIDRGARIFVPYLPIMLIVVLAGLMLPLPGPLHIQTVIANLLMLQDYPLASYLPDSGYFAPLGSARPWWTVAVEWWFYVAFGAVYFLLRRHERLQWSLLLIGAPGFVVVTFQSVSWVLFYPWLCGAIGAFVFLLARDVPGIRYLVPPLLALAIIRYGFHPDFYDLQGMLVTGGLLWAMLMAVHRLEWRRDLSGLASFIAGYSYSLYLLNATVIEAAKLALPPGIGLFVLSVLASNLLAYLVACLTERHYKAVAQWLKQILALRRRGASFATGLEKS